MMAAFRVQAICAMVPAADMKRSMDFYARMGFETHPWQEGADYAFIQRDGNEFHLRHEDPERMPANPGGIYIYVDDADAWYEQLIAAGIETLEKPADRAWGMRDFTLRDPDGLLIGIGNKLKRSQSS